jgi:hypothetical protein
MVKLVLLTRAVVRVNTVVVDGGVVVLDVVVSIVALVVVVVTGKVVTVLLHAQGHISVLLGIEQSRKEQ